MPLYSPSYNGFIDPVVFETLPTDCVEVTLELYEGCVGKTIKPGKKGLPEVVTVFDKPAKEHIEASRLKAYAHPVNGSDRYFVEAMRLKMTGGEESEVESLIEKGHQRMQEIKEGLEW